MLSRVFAGYITLNIMRAFSPTEFAVRPAVAQVETELRQWLRHAKEDERIAFLEGLWAINPHFALSLAHTSQLQTDSALALLGRWIHGDHNLAKPIIQTFVPLLGEKKFWRVVEQSGAPEKMAQMLEYQRHGV
jgi:hypothetical protein